MQRTNEILSTFLSSAVSLLSVQKLCLSSLKRVWSSYLRASYDHFLQQVTRTPSPPPPAATPTPTPDMPPASAPTKEGGKKKKKKKKKKQIKRAVSTLDDDMPGSMHSLVKGKARNDFGSQSRLSRISRISKAKVLVHPMSHLPHLH